MGLRVWKLASTSGKNVLRGNAMKKILIGADLVPTKSNAELFAYGDAETLLGKELQNVLSEADYRIFNLETPLTDVETPIAKAGPALIASLATVKGYAAIGADILTLANNHILDQGVAGLETTLRLLRENNIVAVGVGKTPAEAAASYIFEFAGKKIGLYACAEHEFSIVDDQTPGANPFDPLESLDHIATLKARCDYAIVLYHGGKEHYRYPSPNLQKVCRKLVEKGADLVVCQHSHCVGCEEKYCGGTIVYGQGNFLFDLSDNECWRTGLLIELDAELNVSYLPLTKDGNKTRLARGVEAEEILDGFKKRSQEITVDGFITEKYVEFAATMKNYYLQYFSGSKWRRVWGRINRTAWGRRLTNWVMRRKYNGKSRLAMRNFIECEAHRELFLAGISAEYKNK